MPSAKRSPAWLAAALVAVSPVCAGVALAQTAAPAPEELRQQLDKGQSELRALEETRQAAEDQRRRIEADVELIRNDRARLTAALIETAARARAAEVRMVEIEARLTSSQASEAAIRRTARWGSGWQAGAETPAECAEILARIRLAAAQAGRAIDEDHYGAGFYFWLGDANAPEPARAAAALRARGRDPERVLVVGDAAAIEQRIAEYVAAGVTKFIARPLGQGDETPYTQSRALLEALLPRLAARFPRH